MSFKKVIDGLFIFDPSDKIYKEHFPGNPVVPGSIIMDAFINVLKKTRLIPGNYKIKNFRFKKFISPGEYRYEITQDFSGFSCKLYKNEKAAVTGIILI